MFSLSLIGTAGKSLKKLLRRPAVFTTGRTQSRVSGQRWLRVRSSPFPLGITENPPWVCVALTVESMASSVGARLLINFFNSKNPLLLTGCGDSSCKCYCCAFSSDSSIDKWSWTTNVIFGELERSSTLYYLDYTDLPHRANPSPTAWFSNPKRIIKDGPRSYMIGNKRCSQERRAKPKAISSTAIYFQVIKNQSTKIQ